MSGRGGSDRPRRGSAQNHSSRGSGSTGRGASSSSSLSARTNSPNLPNPYELERNQNAAKRAQRGSNTTTVNGQAGRGRGNNSNKQVHFADSSGDENSVAPKRASSFTTSSNPPTSSKMIPTPSAGGSSKPFARNPFAQTNNAPSATLTPNPFGAPYTNLSQTHSTQPTGTVFGAPSVPTSSNIFGGASQNPTVPPFNAFGKPSNAVSNPFLSKTNGHPSSTSSGTSTTVFGAPSIDQSNPFARNTNGSSTTPGDSESTSSRFGAPSTRNTILPTSASVNSFGSTSLGGKPSGSPFGRPTVPGPSPFAVAGSKKNGTSFFSRSNSANSQATTDASRAASSSVLSASHSNSPKSTFGPGANEQRQPTGANSNSTKITNETSDDLRYTHVNKIIAELKRRHINKPEWPTIDLELCERARSDFPMLTHRAALMSYREKVREALMAANLYDNPKKPKSLAEAIPFKGACEDMCPELEMAERIYDGRFDSFEKPFPKAKFASPERMVKVLARSSAGQDSPLPSDVRTVAALKRTTEYLVQTLLVQHDLKSVHNFIWDRSRAVRRDFVFHSEMSPSELLDQVYCLELITRYHVTTLHLMANEVASGYSEHQELEQLGNTLISLGYAYQDCKAQGVECENEAEFRAYFVLFSDSRPGILDEVQSWGSELWNKSEDLQLAVSLAEMLQSIWHLRGPLAPPAETDIAQNAFSRFFSVIRGKNVSYTMACFAELKFNKVRESILNTILSSYRRQKDQTKDWTLSKLNIYLQFDNESQVVSFCTARGLAIEEDANGEQYLSFSSRMIDPKVAPRQIFSYDLVERKRGQYTLPEVIRSTVYEEAGNETRIASLEDEEDDGLFVKDNVNGPVAISNLAPVASQTITDESRRESPISVIESASTSGQKASPKPTSIFDRIPIAPAPSVSFFPTGNQGISGAAPSTQETKFPAFSSSSVAKDSPHVFAPSTSESPQGSSSTLFPFAHDSPKQIGTTSFETSETRNTKPPITGKSTFFTSSPKGPPPSPFEKEQAAPNYTSPNSNTPTSYNTQLSATEGTPSTAPFSFSSTEHGSKPFAIDTTPKANVPSPPSLSNGLEVTTSTTEPLVATLSLPPKTPDIITATSLFGVVPTPADHSVRLGGLANWYTLGEDGLMDEFTKFKVEEIVREAIENFEVEKREDAARIAEKEEKVRKEEEECFRLARKYGLRWRKLADLLRTRRRGREARQARQEMAESMRASKAKQAANIVEDFRASTRRKRRNSVELGNALQATGLLDGFHNPDRETRAIIQENHLERAHKRHRAQTSTNSHASTSSRHKREKSETSFHRSILSDPSYLSGESRIHHMLNYASLDENRPLRSGVQTDYFRLKARGITTLPDGTALATSAAKSILHHKRSLDGIRKRTPQSSRFLSPARSVPSITPPPKKQSTASHGRDVEIQALKIKAREIVEQGQLLQDQSIRENDDEELFARAKRIREQMDEGAEWFRNERMRRSMS